MTYEEIKLKVEAELVEKWGVDLAKLDDVPESVSDEVLRAANERVVTLWEGVRLAE